MSYGSNAIGQCGGCGEEANTADCGSVMRGFEPHHSPHFFYPKTGKRDVPCIYRWWKTTVWGYSQVVRQRTLTPLSVVRLHLPLPTDPQGNCRNETSFLQFFFCVFFIAAGLICIFFPLIIFTLYASSVNLWKHKAYHNEFRE